MIITRLVHNESQCGFFNFRKNGGFIKLKLRMDQWWLGVKQTMAAISRQFNVIW